MWDYTEDQVCSVCVVCVCVCVCVCVYVCVCVCVCCICVCMHACVQGRYLVRAEPPVYCAPVH